MFPAIRQSWVLSWLKALVWALRGPTNCGLVRPPLNVTLTRTLTGGRTNGQSPVETSGYLNYLRSPTSQPSLLWPLTARRHFPPHSSLPYSLCKPWGWLCMKPPIDQQFIQNSQAALKVPSIPFLFTITLLLLNFHHIVFTCLRATHRQGPSMGKWVS